MRVIWSDETKVNLLESDGRRLAWKRPGERLSDRLVQVTGKFGRENLIIWSCMGWDDVGYSCTIEGRMYAGLYVLVLEGKLQEILGY